MGKKKRQRAALEAMMMERIRQATAPDPTLEYLRNYNQRILDWHLNPTNTVKDIAKHPTIGSKLPTYELAKSFRDKGRIGRGIAGLGSKNSSIYSKDLELEDDLTRGITAAGMLEQGLRGEMDAAGNNLMQITMADASRRSSADGLLTYYHRDLNQRIASGSWGNFFKGLAMSVAPALLGAAFGGGFGMGGGGTASAGPGPSAGAPGGP